MPLPDAQLLNAEIHVLGTLAAGGSDVVPSQNVFHYRRNGTAVPMSKAALNTVFQATVIAPLLAAANSRYTPNNLTIRMIDDPTDFATVFPVAGAGAGVLDGQPGLDAVYMLLRTNRRGRSFRGSKHFGGVNEADTTDDILVGAGLAAWQALRDVLDDNLVDATPNTWTPEIVSKTLSDLTISPASVVAADVSQVLLNLNIGSMRSRRAATVR